MFSLWQMLMTSCNASCGRINFIPPTGWGQTNGSKESSAFLILFALSNPERRLFSEYLHAFLTVASLVGSGNKSFHNKLKWKCWCEKRPLPDKRHIPTWAARTKLHLLLNPSCPKPQQCNTDELYYNN